MAREKREHNRRGGGLGDIFRSLGPVAEAKDWFLLQMGWTNGLALRSFYHANASRQLREVRFSSLFRSLFAWSSSESFH